MKREIQNVVNIEFLRCYWHYEYQMHISMFQEYRSKRPQRNMADNNTEETPSGVSSAADSNAENQEIGSSNVENNNPSIINPLIT